MGVPGSPMLEEFLELETHEPCVSFALSLPGTRPLGRGNVTIPLMASIDVSGTLSRPLWQLSARAWPRGTTSLWR